MRIKAMNMKSCFNCRSADAFIFPDACTSSIDDTKVECVKDTTQDRVLIVGDGCLHWERKTSSGKIILNKGK